MGSIDRGVLTDLRHAAACDEIPNLITLRLDSAFPIRACARRFLVSTEAAELPVTVILNKADLVPKEQCDKAVEEVCATHWATEAHPRGTRGGEL